DTASAVAGVPVGTARCTVRTPQRGVPTDANWAYISSGTWSLMGVEVARADLSPRALELNMTNEGGVNGTYRLLKNIMGLWLVQQCRRSFEKRGGTSDYDALVAAAISAEPFRSFVDPDDPSFLNPPDMPEAIAAYCRET